MAALEQANGFTIFGGPPPDDRSMGRGGHVRDKDGTFAAMLVAELAQYAKEQGMHLLDLLDEKIYLDPDIGLLYITHYEPDPLDGEYEGLAGYTKKRSILQAAERLFAEWREYPVYLGGFRVQGATVYRTGKYDAVNWPGFPDEGFRFYFDEARRSHLTVRPSGTSNALRFHVQLFGGFPTRGRLIAKKAEPPHGRSRSRGLVGHRPAGVRVPLGADGGQDEGGTADERRRRPAASQQGALRRPAEERWLRPRLRVGQGRGRVSQSASGRGRAKLSIRRRRRADDAGILATDEFGDTALPSDEMWEGFIDGATDLYNDVVDNEESRKLDGMTLFIDHDFGWGDFRSTTAWRSFDTVNREDEDGTNRIALYFDTANVEDNESW